METEWDEARLDWMRHLVRINIDRLENPVELNAHDVKRLKFEIGAQRVVLFRLTVGRPLTGVLIDVARYMTVYADLHIEWYGGRLDEWTCREVILEAKKRMWESLSSEARSYVQTGQRE